MKHRFTNAWNVMILALLLAGTMSQATAMVGSWIPMFKGVDHSVSTNQPGDGGLPHRMVIHAMRVDLQDPDIRLTTTPRADNYIPDDNETGGLTVTDFQKHSGAQVVINANKFGPQQYYLPAGTPMDVYGLAIDRGIVVSEEEDPENAATLTFDATNAPSMIFTNWPAHAVDGIYTAVSGTYPVLVGGKDIARSFVSLPDTIHDVNPRTMFGLSGDRRYLYLVAIDGRQPGYSDGAYDYEAAEWLILLGAADGINMDGGGSTTLVVADSTGFPVRLNRSSAVADSGRERTVGSHFGVFAKPLPGFINSISITPDDTTAKISWTTTDPASTQVVYDTTQDLTNSSPLDLTLVTQHNVQLQNLIPNTGYYLRLNSATATQSYASDILYFVTTNYVTTNLLFDLTQPWLFSTQPMSDSNWTTPAFDDSSWRGPGPGLLWIDVRATGPNSDVSPRNTLLPANPGTGYPYITYYLRTHFTISNLVANSSLQLSGYVDDGAIFYVNGTEIDRLRMPSGAVTSQTLADGFPCDGDATCLDQLSVSASPVHAGDNLLAVEVHNYNVKSSDITFGAALNLVQPRNHAPQLDVHLANDAISLSWQEASFVLQAAATLAGPWTDVAAASTSPYVITASEASRFFRLHK